MQNNLFRIQEDNPVYQKSREYEAWAWSRMQVEKEEYQLLDKHELMKSYVARLMFQDESMTIPEYLARKYKKLPKCLTLGCGSGFEDIRFLESGLVDKIVGADLSEDALRQFKKRGEGKYNIETRVTDINFIEIEENAFDLILIRGALHHLINLEHIASQVYRGLKKGGCFLVLGDYIGPNKYQFDRNTVNFTNSFGYYLDRKYPYDFRRLNIVNKKYLKYFSPFEAVFSQDIYPVLNHYFIADKAAVYGNLIAPLSGCFDVDEQKLKEGSFAGMMNEIISFDDFFRQNKILTENYLIAIYHPKPEISNDLQVRTLNREKVKEHIGFEFNPKGLLQKYVARNKRLKFLWKFLKKVRNSLYRFK